MNRADSEAILEASFARPSSTPNTTSLPYEEFLEIEKDNLRQHLIDPIEVAARPCRWAIEHAGFQDNEVNLIAIASDGHDWLLYEESSSFFYLAQKDNDENLLLIGFYSDDALAEWRG